MSASNFLFTEVPSQDHNKLHPPTHTFLLIRTLSVSFSESQTIFGLYQSMMRPSYLFDHFGELISVRVRSGSCEVEKANSASFRQAISSLVHRYLRLIGPINASHASMSTGIELTLSQLPWLSIKTERNKVSVLF